MPTNLTIDSSPIRMPNNSVYARFVLIDFILYSVIDAHFENDAIEFSR